MADPHFSDLIFPQNEQPSMSQLMTSLKRTTLTIHNRLTSIRTDAEFVDRVSKSYSPRPLVANERCGSCIIVVDSTRRGKRMPDALSSTIPIWCTVLNLTLLPSHPSSANLYLPAHLPATTHSQISALIPEFVASLKALNLNLPTCLTKPLRPFWVTPDSSLPSPEDTASIFDDFRPVICCTASRRVVGSEMDEGGYIQGAADDTEMWAYDLTAPLFWENLEQLLVTPEVQLPELISKLVNDNATSKKDEGPKIQLTPHISVCALPLPANSSECRIAITQDTTPKDSWIRSKTYMQAGLGKNKLASRNLRTSLPDICDFAAKYLASVTEPDQQRIVVACDSGKDLSVGVALAISCYLFDDEGKVRNSTEHVSFTKTLIKSRLGFIMTAYPGANPSRSTLQSVNSFLMDWRK
ncbi:tRNA A64-2'-O-ribosylphosphate transferase [Fusarium acuminatum]|uniref:tRNA A64-2'-O-ribosylphosphate transferase n=1 Tax=Fusarium acuminatum TaxID=5515 RepID=A0ABZ2X0Z1_9HYPO